LIYKLIFINQEDGISFALGDLGHHPARGIPALRQASPVIAW
jgi:hypothetical protein